MHCDITERNVT